MAEEGDKITLGLSGDGLRENRKQILFPLTREIINYLGTTNEKISSGEDKLILKFDKSKKHGRFIGIGIKRE